MGTIPVITFTAVPGVTWVLDSATWSGYYAGSSAVFLDPLAIVTSDGVTLFETDWILDTGPAAGAGGSFLANGGTSCTGPFQGVRDNSLIVTTTSANASATYRISASAHPM
jgi:hypothetical protein